MNKMLLRIRPGQRIWIVLSHEHTLKDVKMKYKKSLGHALFIKDSFSGSVTDLWSTYKCQENDKDSSIYLSPIMDNVKSYFDSCVLKGPSIYCRGSWQAGELWHRLRKERTREAMSEVPKSQGWLCLWLVVYSWINHVTFLCLRFLACELMRLNWPFFHI